MKLTVALCAAALIVCAGPVSAKAITPTTTSSAERAVEARSRALINAELHADVAAFRSFLSDDFVLLYVEPGTPGQTSKCATQTKEGWAGLLSSGREKYYSVDIRGTKVYLHGDVAIFAGEYTQGGTRDGKEYTEGGLFTETWVKRQGQWILIGGVFP